MRAAFVLKNLGSTLPNDIEFGVEWNKLSKWNKKKSI